MSDVFINSILQIQIPSFSEKAVNQKNGTYYILNITNLYSNKKWVMEKEFDEFINFQQKIASIIPDPPEIEGKSMFKVTSFDALQKRQTLLEKFIRKCCVRKDIMSNDYFKQFLDLENQAPEICSPKPEKISEYTNVSSLGIRDFIYLRENDIFFMICSDMQFTSRVDAYITNVSLPWEEKSESHITVGSFIVFKALFDNNKGFKFKKLYAQSYPQQTGSLSYDTESNNVCIGLDNGRIIFYKINPDSNFSQYEPYIDFNPHKKRVTGLAYDSKTGFIYSCSLDKKFYVTEIGYLNNPSEIIEGPCGFSNMFYDKRNQRIFLTNEYGMISIYHCENFPPTLLNNIQTSCDECIRGFDINFIKNYIFTTHVNGQITVLELNIPGKEKLIKEISYFGTGIKLRCVIYIMEENQLITGDEIGRILIWNLKTGKVIYAWKAHEKAITKMNYFYDTKLLITASKDKMIKAWRIPDKWFKEEIKKFEDNEIKNMNDTMAMLKLQQTLKDDEDYNSDEDSLNGWDFKPDLDEH